MISMYPVNSAVDLGNVNHTELGVGSNGVKTGKASFNEKKIKQLQSSLSVNLTMLAKKRAVAYGSIFTSNMFDKTSFGSKVKQLFENIKLKFWDVSKSISKDCEKLEKLLTKGVTASLGGGGSQTDVIGGLKDEISKFLEKEPLYGENSIEPLKSYPRNHARLSALKTRVEELHKFSEFADKLNNFHLPYEEENFNADDEQTQRNLLESLKQFYQTKNRFDDLLQSSSIKGEQLSSIKEAYDTKRQDIEDRIRGKQMVVDFYNTLDLGNLTDDELVKKCASAVDKMKSAETLLNKAEDLLAKDGDSDKYQRFGQDFKSRWLPAEASDKYKALGVRLNRIASPKNMEEAVQQNKKRDEDDDIEFKEFHEKQGKRWRQVYRENPEEMLEAIKKMDEEEDNEVSQRGEAGKQVKTVLEYANIPYIADGEVEEDQQEEIEDNSFDIRKHYHSYIPEDDAEVVFANENSAVQEDSA